MTELESCEKLIEASDELLYRQVTKHLWDDTTRLPSKAAFGPATSDAGRPSFARSSVNDVGEQSSRDWHQRNARSPSVGVWATSTSEVEEAKLAAIDDAACPVPEGANIAPGHCYVDYRDLQPREIRDARAILLLRAIQRGELPTTDCLGD